MKFAAHGTWRSPCGKYTLHLRRDCIDEMTRLAQAHVPNEVGTALVGTYSDDGHEATIERLAPLTPDSRGARFTFVRGARGLREFFRSVFASSRGTVHYVGEWHSHPGGEPHPSGTDDANMFSIAKNPKTLCPECILVILAIHEHGERVGAFVYSRARGRVDLKEQKNET
jgi:integrative and conjugative element protein (TIGR02256 family)